MTIRSKAEELVNSITPVLILIVCCVTSLLIATNVRCHGSLALYLYEDLPVYVERNEVHWLGATHGMIVYMFVPLIAGLIDHFKVSYRICMAAAGVASLLSCLLSAGFSEPGYMIFTDTVAAGGAASVMLSTVLLVVDDYFPRGSSLRIFATTMVQGVAIATFFLIDGYSIGLKLAGWRAIFYGYGASACALGILGGLLFHRPVRPHSPELQRQPQQQPQKPLYSPLPSSAELSDAGVEAEVDDADAEEAADQTAPATPAAPGEASVIDQLFEKKDWKKRLLSLSLVQLQSSRTSLLWLCERLLAAVVSDGVFLFLLLHSGIAKYPFIAGSTPSPAIARITTAFLFTVGSSASYLGGGILGCLIKGHLLIVYMVGALVNLCALIGWVAVLDAFYHGELVFAWFCGLGIGAINTFAFAASEEATGIPARSIFPFTKMANGLSIVTIEVTHSALTSKDNSQLDILLIVLLLLSLGEFALLVLIRQINRRLDASVNRFRSTRGRLSRTIK